MRGKPNAGLAMVVALLLTALIFSTLLVAVSYQMLGSQRSLGSDRLLLRAFLAAESGLDAARHVLAVASCGSSLSYPGTYHLGGGRVTLSLYDESHAPLTNLPTDASIRVVVVSSASVGAGKAALERHYSVLCGDAGSPPVEVHPVLGSWRWSY